MPKRTHLDERAAAAAAWIPAAAAGRSPWRRCRARGSRASPYPLHSQAPQQQPLAVRKHETKLEEDHPIHLPPMETENSNPKHETKRRKSRSSNGVSGGFLPCSPITTHYTSAARLRLRLPRARGARGRGRARGEISAAASKASPFPSLSVASPFLLSCAARDALYGGTPRHPAAETPPLRDSGVTRPRRPLAARGAEA